MYDENELLPISALQHLAFCERQWGLIHLEQLWNDNRLTVDGSHFHDRVHEEETETRGDLRISRGLRLRSLRLGLIGRADVVEFHRLSETEDRSFGLRLESANGFWKPLVVEYKRGKPKADHCDKVQLCAQALCLEEMLAVSLPTAVLFYGNPRRRYEVRLDDSLREKTETLAARLHSLSHAGRTPSPRYARRCENCSLVQLCLPKAVGARRSVHRYLSRAIAQAVEEG